MTDPRWLEILKSSGGQAFAAAGACGAFLLAAHWKWIPPLDPWMIHATSFAFVLFGLLAVSSFGSAINKFIPLKTWILHYVNVRRQQKDAESYIPHMNEHERDIVAYLLHHKQKMFTCASDGGNAVTLISRGIIVRALLPGQVFLENDMPVAVPDHIWIVLERNRDKFPYEESDGVYPWRRSWMA